MESVFSSFSLHSYEKNMFFQSHTRNRIVRIAKRIVVNGDSNGLGESTTVKDCGKF